MDLKTRLDLERQYHKSEDKLRDENSLIVGVYASGLFDEANDYLADSLGDIQEKPVLDYGCSTGQSSAQLADRGAVITGFDISLARLVDAKQLISDRSGMNQAPFAAAAAENLPFADESFDAIYGKHVLHHLDLNLAIPEVVRVLRPGGRAAFLEPLIHNPLLEGYRRLTPHLRSPSEKALSMNDIQAIGSQFNAWQHKEFCFLAVVPVLAEVILARKVSLKPLTTWLQKADRRMVETIPPIGRYYWETVLILEK